MLIGRPRSFFTLATPAAAMLGLVFLLLILGAAPAPEAAAKASGSTPAQTEGKAKYVRIFAISRSLNANLVSYEVHVGPAGFDTRRPVRARWEMLAAGGHSEDLNFLEQGVYGVNVESVKVDELRFSIGALPSRKFTVRLDAEGPRALVEVGGVLCVLDSIHISSSGGLIPSVRYAELRGRSLADGSAHSERVRP